MEKNYITIEQVRKNVLKSYFLIFILGLIAFSLSVLIGYLWDDISMGVLVGAVICLIVFPIQMLTAKMTILAMTKGKKADKEIFAHDRLINIVEGLSISAGMKRVPDVYIIPTNVPNAFASGMSEKDAFIGVTNGLLDMLDERELTGVIAHEMSHIVHRDIMVTQLAVSLVSVILILAGLLSRIAIFGGGRRSSKNDNNSSGAMFMVIIMLLAVLLRPLASLVANLIQLSISRKREYAADAYAVRLCGFSEGLAGALEKIGGITSYTKEQEEELGGNQLKAMYISFPTKSISALFSTHPPIEERIKILRNMY